MFGSFFKPVPRWDMARAKEYIASRKLDEYNLVDVRQPEEYAQEHIPGATLIPLGELPARLGELDPGKVTLVYCRSGGRAGNGTALLSRAGFEQAHNIGGIPEWNGLVATGAPEAGMAIFDAAREPAEYIALAWQMEEGARRFYTETAGKFPELGEMFQTMAVGEERHRDQLAALHQEATGQAGDPASLAPAGLMEGGIDLEQALTWAAGREAADLLELAATMEANAHDRYILVGRELGGEIETVLMKLAEAEKVHLGQLMEAFSERLG